MTALSATDLLTAADRAEIHELTTAYGVHHDLRDFAALEACFVPQATYLMRVADGTVHGPREGSQAIVAQIREFKAKQTDKRRHHITNIQITPRDVNTADVLSYVLVTAVQDRRLEVLTVGTYTDVVTRTPHGWRILHKTLVLDTSF